MIITFLALPESQMVLEIRLFSNPYFNQVLSDHSDCVIIWHLSFMVTELNASVFQCQIMSFFLNSYFADGLTRLDTKAALSLLHLLPETGDTLTAADLSWQLFC